MEANNTGSASSARRRSQPKTVEFKLEDDHKLEKDEAPKRPASLFQGLSHDPVLLALSALIVVLIFVAATLSRFEVRPVQPHITSIESEYKSNPRLDVALNGTKILGAAPKTHALFWRITSESRRPDGVLKRLYLINGQFPGPVIEAQLGDILEITVENALEDEAEGLAVHFHGLHNRDLNEMDGTVGFTQCPIMPGSDFTYVVKLSQKGSFWYHSHYQVQRADGFYGGLIVHGDDRVLDAASEDSSTNDYDEDRLLLIGDWYHRSAKDVLGWYLRAASFGNEPVPDSLLINGLGAYDCSQGVPARPIDCDVGALSNAPVLSIDLSKRYRFRLVNVGTLAGVTIKIPGANMHAFQVDGGSPISGESASSVGILYPGERVDLLVSFSNIPAADEHYVEIELENENFKYPNPALTRKQRFPILPLSYGWPRYASAAKNKPAETFDLTLANSTGALVGMPEKADITFVLYTTTMKLSKNHNVPEGFINQTSWRAQKDPLILLPRSQWDAKQFVPFIQYNKSSPRWVDIVLNNLDDGSHPFHLHSNDFYVLSSCADGTYFGSYNPFDTTVSEPPCGPYNLENPVRKDTVYVPKRGYTVLRFRADNEGLHMFHCHILWHQASGMAMGFHVGEDEEANISQSWTSDRLNAVRKVCE